MIAFSFAMRRAIGSSLALVSAAVALWMFQPTPALALNPGCSCLAGTIPVGANTCRLGPYTFPASCGGPGPTALNQSIGHMAASSQQLSFEGVEAILQGRRDQLQGTLGKRNKQPPMVSGYAPSELDEDFDGLAYAAGSKSSNPLAMPVKAPPAPAASSGPSFASWIQGLGDWEHNAAASAADNSHFASTYTAQGGVDETWQNVTGSGDALVIGIVGSYTHALTIYPGAPTSTKLSGPGVGLYSTYVNGGFSADLTGKFDFLGLAEDFAGIAPPNFVNVTNGGASGNIQYKVSFSGGGFVEPTTGFSYTRTMFGSGAVGLGLADASTVRLQAGSRWGTTWDSNGISFEPSLKAVAYSNVIAEGSSAANNAIVGIVPSDQGKIRGEVSPDLELDFGNGASATLSASVRFGEGMIGGSAGINVRRQW